MQALDATSRCIEVSTPRIEYDHPRQDSKLNYLLYEGRRDGGKKGETKEEGKEMRKVTTKVKVRGMKKKRS